MAQSLAYDGLWGLRAAPVPRLPQRQGRPSGYRWRGVHEGGARQGRGAGGCFEEVAAVIHEVSSGRARIVYQARLR